MPFVVHCGFFLTEETEAADLFVPATFGPESQGSGYGNEQQVVWREKMVQAPGLSLIHIFTGEKDNYWTGGAMCPKGMSIVCLLYTS